MLYSSFSYIPVGSMRLGRTHGMPPSLSRLRPSTNITVVIGRQYAIGSSLRIMALLKITKVKDLGRREAGLHVALFPQHIEDMSFNRFLLKKLVSTNSRLYYMIGNTSIEIFDFFTVRISLIVSKSDIFTRGLTLSV